MASGNICKDPYRENTEMTPKALEEGPTEINIFEIQDVLLRCRRLIRRMMLLSFGTLVLFMVVLCIQGIFILQSEFTYKGSLNTNLYDRLQKSAEAWSLSLRIALADYLIGIIISLMLILLIFSTPFAYTVQIFIRYLFLMAIMYMIRGLFVYLTVIPPPRSGCVPLPSDASYFRGLIYVFQSYLSIKESCTDLIISGHTMGITTASVIFVHNNSYRTVNYPLAILLLVIYFSLIVSKSHYTIDVLFGLFFSTQIYYSYFTMLDAQGTIIINKVQRMDDEIPESGETLSDDRLIFYPRFLPVMFAYVEQLPERITLNFHLSKIQKILKQRAYLDLMEDDMAVREKDIEFYCRLFGASESVSLKSVYGGSHKIDLGSIKIIDTFLRRITSRRRNKTKNSFD